MFRRIGLFVVATVTAVTALVAGPQAAVWANTGGSCTAPVVRYPSDSINAFMYHRVLAEGKVCLRYYGPGRIQFTRTPSISFPERVIGAGIAESISVKTAPYTIAESSTNTVYRFVVHQSVYHVPGGQDFTFTVHYTDAGHYMQFGSTYSNYPYWS